MQRQPFERKSYLAYLLAGLGVFVGISPSSAERFWHQCISSGILPSLGSRLKWLSTPNSTSSLFQTLRTNWSLRFIPTIRLWGILLSLSSAIAFLWYRRYMRKLFDRFAVLFISVDMGNIVEYYGMKEVVVVDEKGEKKSDWTPAGQSGFWVVEPVGGQDAGEIVGCVGLVVRDSNKPEGEVRRMVIAPSHRRLGVAGMLLDAVNDHAKKTGLTSLYLSTSELQPAARRLYEKRGWVVEGARYEGDWLWYVKAFTYRLKLDEVRVPVL